METSRSERPRRDRTGVRELLYGDGGQDLIEYALLSALISLAAVVSVPAVRATIATLFQTIADQLAQ